MPIDDALQELKKEVLTPVKTQPNTNSLAYIKQETDKELWEICNSIDKKLNDFLSNAIELNSSFDKKLELEKNKEQEDSDRTLTFKIETVAGIKSAVIYLDRKVFRPTIENELIIVQYQKWKKYKKVEVERIPRKIFGISLGEKIVYDKVLDGEISSLKYDWIRYGYDYDDDDDVRREEEIYAFGKSQGFFQTLIDLYYKESRTAKAILRMLNQAPDIVNNYFGELRDSSKEFKV